MTLKKPLKDIFRRLTDEDVRKAQAKPSELLELVMLRYGLAREQVEPMMATVFVEESDTNMSLDEVIADRIEQGKT